MNRRVLGGFLSLENMFSDNRKETSVTAAYVDRSELSLN